LLLSVKLIKELLGHLNIIKVAIIAVLYRVADP
jgi:hypothetical protein